MNDTEILAVFRDGFAIDRDVEEREPDPASSPRRRTRRSTEASSAPKPRVAITCQFRDARAMVYDFNVGERKIELRMQPSTVPHAGWSVALVVKGDALSFDAWGVTRPIAVAALEGGTGELFPSEDWASIREALSGVRAL
jgi:hypothetical protein